LSVWLTIPSKRPPEEAEKVLKLWRERGYRIALYCDPNGDDVRAKSEKAHHITVTETYPGYANAVNTLIRKAIDRVADAEWFIAAGDDVEPDPNKSAEEIARECNDYFYSLNSGNREMIADYWTTFGVMQPTGDRWGDHGDGKGAYIDRVCGSAWIGREFARRMYQGKGPLWPEYWHMFVDEELQEVAKKYGVLWQRPDLTQIHRHWGRGPDDDPNRIQAQTKMPPFLVKANEGFASARKLFNERKAAGFPGSEPIA